MAAHWAAQIVPSGQSSINPIDIAESLFLDAANGLVEQLRLASFGELGCLYDSIVYANAIAKRPKFGYSHGRRKAASENRQSFWIAILDLYRTKSNAMTDTATHSLGESHAERVSASSSFVSFESSEMLEKGYLEQQQLDLPSTYLNAVHPQHGGTKMNRIPSSTATDTFSVQNSQREDCHIFLVRLVNKEAFLRLLSVGFRFADQTFISKTMGNRLCISPEHMFSHLNDMRLYAESALKMMQLQPCPVLSTADPRSRSISCEDTRISEVATRSAVYVGLSVLVQEDQQSVSDDDTSIVVDKSKRHAIPMVQLRYDDGEIPSQLSREEKNRVLSLQGQTLMDICAIETRVKQARICHSSTLFDSHIGLSEDLTSCNGATTLVSSGSQPSDNCCSPVGSSQTIAPVSPTITQPTTRFLKAMETAAQQLIGLSSYSKLLGGAAELHAEVMDIPAFSLQLAPCQLILFRACVTFPGVVSAVNQTSSEPFKCLPLPLYRPMAYYITDHAVSLYRSLNQCNASTYIMQQRLYQFKAYSSKRGIITSKEVTTKLHHVNNNTLYYQQQQGFPEDSISIASLPPPPRPKRPKLHFLGTPSLVLSILDALPEKSRLKPAPALPSSLELPPVFTVLPTQNRFWWLNCIVEEIIHG